MKLNLLSRSHSRGRIEASQVCCKLLLGQNHLVRFHHWPNPNNGQIQPKYQSLHNCHSNCRLNVDPPNGDSLLWPLTAMASKLSDNSTGNFDFFANVIPRSEFNNFIVLLLKCIPSESVQVKGFGFDRLQIQPWFRVVFIESNSLRRSLVSNSVGRSFVACVYLRWAALFFAATGTWKSWANWLMMALYTQAANLWISARIYNIWPGLRLFKHLRSFSRIWLLFRMLNLFREGGIMQFLAINTSNRFPAILFSKQRVCSGNWRFSRRRLAVISACFHLLAGFSGFYFFLDPVSSNSSIFQTSSFEFRATCSRISLGSLDMIIGINKPPYCSGDTSNEASPRVWTLIWS